MAADEIVDNIPIVGALVNFLFPKDRQPGQELNVSQRLESAVTNDAMLSGTASLIHNAESVPVVGAGLKFVLEFGNRTADSLFTAGAALGDDDETTSYFDGWRQGWDSWGTADHLTAGQIFGASINNGLLDTGISPFTPQGIKQTQTLARSTWYGDIAGAATDISAAFILPGPGAVKLARAGKSVDTLAAAEDLTTAFNSGQRAGRTGAFFKPTSPAAQATRLENLSKEIFDRSESMTDVMNFIGPMTTASPRGARVVAEVAVDARKLGPEMGQHVIGNAMLTFMGSEGARAELMSASPLIASKIANATMAPQPLANAALAAERLHAQFLADPANVNINQILGEVMNTPRKVAEEKALAEAVAKSREEAIRARELRGRLASLRPRNRTRVNGEHFDLNADNLTIKEARAKAEAQHNDLKGQLDEAKADLQANPADAAARQRVSDLSQRLGEARADRDLLRSTPLDEFGYTTKQWREDMFKARGGARVAQRRNDMYTALHRTAKRELAADAKMSREIYPGLSAQYDWLADLDALGRGDAALPSLKLQPSRLDRMKTAIRDEVGASYLYEAGEFNRKVIFHVMPKSWTANIGTAYGRSAINVLDRYTGAQELGMYLKKSKEYAPDEIKALTEEFHRLQPGKAEGWVARLQDDLAERIVRSEAPHLAEADVKKAVASVARGMGQNREYLAKAVNESDGQWASIREFPDLDASDAIHMVDAAYLRSHLAETAAFVDPVMLRKAIKDYDSAGSLAHMAARSAVKGLDLTLGTWKLAQLLRPGLMVRNALDSNVRAYSLMGTVPTVIQAAIGTKHLLRNTGIRVGDWTTVRKAKIPVLERIGAQDPSGVVRTMLNDVKFKTRDGQDIKGSLYDLTEAGDLSAVSVAMARSAMTKGMSPSQGLLHAGDRSGVKFTRNSNSWDMYQPTSKEWSRAYADHAKVLLASPTAREIINNGTLAGDASVTLGEITKELFSKPAVRDEYAKLRENHNMTQQEFIAQTIRETDVMFPEPGMAQDMLAGRFHGAAGKKWIEDHFPPEQRFAVPGEESIFRGGANFGRVALDRIFKILQDEPDFILARHPVAFHSFKTQFKKEAQALVDARLARGEDALITAADLAKIQARARTYAISRVRDYMYDATRQTGISATATMNRLVPFLAPWADTMRAYSRLLYDDPTRLAKINGLYNAPFNASVWMQNPIIVDQYGNAVSRSQRDSVEGGTYVLINGDWSKNAQTGQMQGKGGLALRASSFNTILQGDVPWLPGWGPALQLPVQAALNSNDKLALYLSESENPAVQTLMHSLFADGEVPQADANAIWKTAVPSWLRRFVDAKDGITYGRNVGYLMNQKFLDAQSKGVPFDQKRALEEAQSEATSAAWVQMVSQFGFGLSGDAQVQGKFYVQKMHEFQALAVKPADGSDSPLKRLYGTDDPTAVFAQQFPEAKDLSWSFSRNETGINATVKAQSSALDLKGLIDANPEYGWFILGGDNVGGDFSQTAYNQQRSDTYGATQKGRKQLDPGEIAQKVRVSQGWSEFTKWTTELSNAAAAYGLSSQDVSDLKKAIVAQIGSANPDWYGEFNNRTNKVQDFYQRADLLANDPKLAQRQDIAMYATYRQAQQEVLAAAGLQSFAGTSLRAETAREVMYKIGSDMAAQNIGFQQMWERVLSNDVEPKETTKVMVE